MRTRPRAFSFDTHVSVGGSRGADSNAISGANTEMTELQECLRRQQAQLDAILSQLNLSRPQANLKGVGGQSKTYRFNADGRPICIRCNRAGHTAKYCHIDPNSTNVATQWVGQRAVAHNQLVESPAPLQPQENQLPLVWRAKHQGGLNQALVTRFLIACPTSQVSVQWFMSAWGEKQCCMFTGHGLYGLHNNRNIFLGKIFNPVRSPLKPVVGYNYKQLMGTKSHTPVTSNWM